jgi:hypothetical protein
MSEDKKPKLGSGKRFKILTESLAAKGADDPKGLAAWIGMNKYGKKKMSEMAAAGRKRANKTA